MDKFTVIEGGKSNNPGATRELPFGLPPGFKPSNHAARDPNGIPCIGPDGSEGELVMIDSRDMPPFARELLAMILMGALTGRKA